MRRLFHFFLPKCGVYKRAAFKRENTVFRFPLQPLSIGDWRSAVCPYLCDIRFSFNTEIRDRDETQWGSLADSGDWKMSRSAGSHFSMLSAGTGCCFWPCII